jgi:hypothetical protein
MRTLWLSCLCACVATALGSAPAAAQEAYKPGPQHEMLKKFEGQWDATVAFGGSEAKASASYKLGLGGLWLLLHFKADFGGMPFEGRGVTGYDPHKKKYVSSWVDSMAPSMTVMEGSFSNEGKTFTESGEGIGPDGKLQKLKSVYDFEGQDKIVFTMYQVADGKDQEMMKITYVRKK